jgi:hypothetical protein
VFFGSKVKKSNASLTTAEKLSYPESVTAFDVHRQNSFAASNTLRIVYAPNRGIGCSNPF